MKLNIYKSAIILPLKESFTQQNFGAVSIWVKDYLNITKNIKNIFVFCKKKNKNEKYLTKNVKDIKFKKKVFTNINYIKEIGQSLEKNNIRNVEIHNRPEYAKYLINKYPKLNIVLIFHNDPNFLRDSSSNNSKEFLLKKCKKIIFVSKWLKAKFFEKLPINHKNNVDVIYNFVKPIKNFPNKKKIIVFSGKLNSQKGYNIFGNAIIKVLNKNPEWSALVYGNEPREKFSFKHKRLKINDWISHSNLLKIYEKSSISVVNPVWNEPFGRTAMESSSRGCAVITSKSGGLQETFFNNLILKKNNVIELSKLINKLINNKNLLIKIQKKNFNSIRHKPNPTVKKLDKLKFDEFHIFPSVFKNKRFKILHIGNFGEKNDHRLFNISIANKLSLGFIRNNHDVINFDYRNFSKKSYFGKYNLDDKIKSIYSNYKPDLILLGHNNILKRDTLNYIKTNNSKIGLWYEDHVIKGDPYYRKNLDLIEQNSDLIDNFFITTCPSIIKSKIKKDKINFLPIPVDPNIESGNFFEIPKEKDLFFAISHGVNYGMLKDNVTDERSLFINKLIKISNERINYNLFGLFGEQPKWNYEFNREIMISKTALNLSRGGPSKYCSSNRIATIMGNGILPFIHEKVKYQDFFQDNEIITYKNETDLLQKLLSLKDNKKELIKRSRLAKKNYFKYFENTIISDSIINIIFGTKEKYKYIWIK
tara:strand:+ start:991 stop:3102 length:2112 start_codon:yes stop_codon:yes gene_type:complete